MIQNLVQILENAISADRSGRLDWVQSVRYGAPQAISTVEMPCFLFNLLSFSITPQIGVSAKFGLYACSAITATKEEASEKAQKLAWYYGDSAPYDRGLLPWILSLGGKSLSDSLGRHYRAVLLGDPKIITDSANGNVRGAVYCELELKTIIGKIS